ncbi:hypothetical protein [Oribacterium sp. FC2011]|uniref:hypothetical protein n=1 Tax=Oribacterium sp. FC2011 TaxID=1408311 RepID=UPI0004E255EF|nr:hypothetical protein [Oribacterium sp. FC2011]
MSRKKRLWYPGASYHVMSRGNRRTVLFKLYIIDVGRNSGTSSTIESGERYGREIELVTV